MFVKVPAVLLLLFRLLYYVQGQTGAPEQINPGQVNVGVPGQDGSNVVSISEHETSGQIPVFLTFTQPANATQDVTVFCSIQTDQPGYSEVTFDNITISAGGTDTGTVTFSVVSPGRQVEVQCLGRSAAPGTETNTTEFLPQTSAGQTGFLQVRKGPVAGFCSSLVLVPNRAGVSQATVRVELSEAVVDNEVTVTCTSVDATAGSIQLTFDPLTLEVNSTTGDVTYSFTNPGGSPVSVSCTAQSGGGGTQYRTATSTGDASTFALDEGSVQFIPDTTRTSAQSVGTFLVLDAAVQADTVTFTCAMREVEDSDQAQTLAQNPTCVPVSNLVPTAAPGTVPAQLTTPGLTTPNPASASPATTLTQAPISAQTLATPTSVPDSPLTNLSIAGNWQLGTVELVFGTYTSPVQDLLLVTCCAPQASNTDPKYQGRSAAFVFSSNVVTNTTANLTNAEVVGTPLVERVIPNPAYVEVGPCPCDLWENHCDTECCCDTECTQDDLDIFTSCIQGAFGGNLTKELAQYCTFSGGYQEDWDRLLCVERDNSPYLGLYYDNPSAIRTETAFRTAYDANAPAFSFDETERRETVETDSSLAYRYGLATQVLYTDANGETQQGFLSFPQQILSGQCLYSGIVRHFVSSNATCTQTLDASLCTEGSMLDAREYLLPSAATHPPCPTPPRVLSQHGGVDTVPTTVEYFCLTDPSLYVRSTTTADDIYVFNQTSLFADSVPGTMQKCAFDDGFTFPPSPTPNTTTDTCSNVVLDVRYVLSWRGTELTGAAAFVILGDIAMETVTPGDGSNSSTVLAQKFGVEFSYDSPNATAVDATEIVDRSGNPGYDVGKVLLTGTLSLTNDSVENIGSSGLQVWSPGTDGLCTSASRAAVTFGEDSISGCTVRLAWDNFQDCAALRSEVRAQQESLVTAEFVSRGGNPNSTLITDWVQIINNDTAAPIEAPTPAGVEPDVVDQLQGLCQDIPAAMNLEVLYADVGKENEFLIQEVVGARVSFSSTLWKLQCSGPLSAACYGNSSVLADLGNSSTISDLITGTVQSFYITSSVTFTRVPALTPAPVKRFYANSTNVCRLNACWEELFYPVSMLFADGDFQRYQHNLGSALLLTLFIIAVFVITRPWW
ncbi:PREDICTED: tectonic-2-like [Branchiostoma belcheri]|uniref:Tectonic-2-like n=1 Tax=Branchiostoma belcheri TaxID=7741 RepID=A0A6P5A2H6_BRABE|nr:PREDICTED: tectonic-2-like [Branchiostoma belcheri]